MAQIAEATRGPGVAPGGRGSRGGGDGPGAGPSGTGTHVPRYLGQGWLTV